MAHPNPHPQPPPSSASSSYVPSSGPTRHSSSSFSSDAYAPSIPGFLTLTLHGNCSKCHHHHNSRRVMLNVSRSRNVTTDLRCQRCNEKWLVFGGRNTTQLSLLSMNTTKSDPVAKEVRYSLVDMVRTTTFATLSPTLAGIVESATPGPSRQHSMHSPSEHESRTADSTAPTPPNPGPSYQPSVFEALNARDTTSLPTPLAVRPITTQKYGFMTGRRMSHIKESLAVHFPVLHRANLRNRFNTLTKSKTSAKQLGKQPVGDPISSDATSSTILPMDLLPSLDRDDELPLEPGKPSIHNSGPNCKLDTPSAAAVEFIASLKDDPTDLSSLTAKEKADWIRAKYTIFRNGTAASVFVDEEKVTAFAGIAVAVSREEINERFRRSIDLLGVGGRQSPSARSYSVRASVISDTVSEADTVTDEINMSTPGPRASWIEEFRSERSSVTPPPSLNAYTLQRLRFRRAALRRSADSTITVDVISSTSRPGPSTTDQSSQGSTIRGPSPNHAEAPGADTIDAAHAQMDDASTTDDAIGGFNVPAPKATSLQSSHGPTS